MTENSAHSSLHTGKGTRKVVALLAVVFCMFVGTSARAAEPVALVIETEGNVSVEPFSEILEGQTVELSSGATMRFTIYAACEEVNVRSGRVTFSRTNFRINAGRVLSKQKTSCPEVAESGNGAMGGVLLRGPGTPVVCRRPGFILTGPDAPQIDGYDIQGYGFDDMRHTVSQRTLTLPEGKIFAGGETYRFRLFSQGAVQSEIELKGNGRVCRQNDLTILRVK